MNTVKVENCKTLFIGRRGENEVTEVVFDFTEWQEQFGTGVIDLYVKRSVDFDAYPVVLSIDGTVATWLVTAADTDVVGSGKIEFVYTVDQKVAKSAIFPFYVGEDIGQASSEPPDPYESWIETLTELGTETQANAQAAAQSASDAADSAASASESAGQAEDSAEDAEAWAVGERDGEPVSAGDETYENNAKYWAENARANAPVQSVNGKDGNVELTLDDIPNGETYARATPAQLAQIGKNADDIADIDEMIPNTTNESNPLVNVSFLTNRLTSYRTSAAQDTIDAGKQEKITAYGILKRDRSGNITAAIAGADYVTADALNSYRKATAQDAIDNAQDQNINKNTAAINTMQPAATAAEIGKALIVKTVADGKPTSYEYGDAGGGGSALTAGDGIDLTNDVISNTQGIEYIVGTQTAATSRWTGNSTDEELKAGKIIAYYLPFAGTSTAATLALTMGNGTTTREISLQLKPNATVTTQFPAGSIIILVYDGSYWRVNASYDTDTNTYPTGYCLTNGSVAAKAAACSFGYRGDTNYFPCLFRYANTAADATLAITTYAPEAAPIYVNGQRTSATNTFSAGVILFLYYNGAYYCYNDGRFPILVDGAVTSVQEYAAGLLADYRTAAAQDTIDAGKQAKITATGILKGDGDGGVSAAVAGTDYLAPSALETVKAYADQAADSAAAAEDAQEAAEAVLASIPADYTELTEDVDNLKSHINGNDYIDAYGNNIAINVGLGNLRTAYGVTIERYNIGFKLSGAATSAIAFVVNEPGGKTYAYSGYTTSFKSNRTSKSEIIAGHRYKVVRKLIKGTVTKGSTTYTPETFPDSSGAHLVNVALFPEDNTSALLTSPASGVINVSTTGIFCVYIYSGVSFSDDATFIAYCVDLDADNTQYINPNMETRLVGIENELSEVKSNLSIVPDYWRTEIEQSVTTINNNIMSNDVNSVSLAFITDCHWRANAQHSPAIMKEILDRCNIRYFVNGGDILEASTTKTKAIEEITDIIAAFKICRLPMYTLYGNHDRNRYASDANEYLTTEEHWNLVFKSFDSNEITWVDTYKAFYWEDATHRYVCIYWWNSSSRVESFVAAVCNTDKKIILITHGLYFHLDSDPAEDTMDSAWIINNFEPYKDKIRCIIQGHSHIDALRYAWETVPVIILDCDKLDSGAVEGTITEQSMSVLTIGDSTINVVKIGRGTDFNVTSGTPIFRGT